jgi:broad specificity phosphatase PhoE
MEAFTIPESTLRAIWDAPDDRATLLLIRHSVREFIPPGELGNDARLLPEGKSLARELGMHVGARLSTVHTSPVLRCLETAHAIVEGAAVPCQIVVDHHLGDPGIYVVDGSRAWDTWQLLSHEHVMAQLVAGVQLAGFSDPALATRRLLQHMQAAADSRPGVHMFITHDSILTTAAAHLLKRPLSMRDWPSYLEAVALVDNSAAVHVTYRKWKGELRQN